MKLLRLRHHKIIFEFMEFTSKVIVRHIAVWRPFCIYWICVSKIKVTMDTSVSLQGKNNNHENESLEMVSMAKICRCISLTSTVWLKVITQIKHWMMRLAWYGRKVSAQEKATLGVGVMLSQSCCYGYHDYDHNIYLKFFLLSTTWCIFWPNFGLLLHTLSA